MTYINWDSPLHFNPHTFEVGKKGIPVPSYGVYGGPGNTSTTNETPKDLLDAAYQEHDAAYALATDTDALSAADAELLLDILALDLNGDLSDPEAALYAGFSSLAFVGQLALRSDLEVLGDELVPIVVNAIDNVGTGLPAVQNEGRSLHGALHIFEHKFLDDVLDLI
jgi:hypothetical protein